MFNVCTFTTSLLSLLYSSWLPTYIYIYHMYINCYIRTVRMYLYELLYILYVCYICAYVGIRVLLYVLIGIIGGRIRPLQLLL